MCLIIEGSSSIQDERRSLSGHKVFNVPPELIGAAMESKKGVFDSDVKEVDH